MNLLKDKTKVLMLTHYNFRDKEGEDTDQRIFRYLKDRAKKIALITHPFPEFGGKYSYLTIYQDGELFLEKKVKVIQGPNLCQFFQHIFITYYFLFFTGLRFDLCIALENLSFISIYPFRFFWFIKRLVYYSIDFVPQRFQNPLLNWLYHKMDKFACQHSDVNWIMTKQMIKPRKKFSITPKNSSPFVIVPIGYEIKNINVRPFDQINLYNIVYAGGLRESYGPQIAIKAMPYLIKKFPKIRLTIIGVGKFEGELKRLINQLKIAKYVDFKGFIPKFKDLTDTIAKHSIALAPYIPTPGNYSYYSDPSKIKLYMCCGLPVVTTNVSTLTKTISQTSSGIIIDYSEKALADAVILLLSDRNKYNRYKQAAIRLSKRFDINHIMTFAFEKIPE